MEKVRSALFAKIEAELGTDPTPVEGTDAIECYGEPQFELVTSIKPRNVPISTFGELAPLVNGDMYKISGISVPNKGSGSAGTAPRIDPLLRGLGLSKTVNAGVSVVYTPHSSFTTETFTAYIWKGGTRHILTGCIVSSAKESLQAGEPRMLDLEIIGFYGGTISDVAFPAPTFESTSRLIWQAANFKAVISSVDVALVVSKFEWDLGIESAKRMDPNGTYGYSRHYIKDRKTKVSLDPEKEALTTFNPYTLHTAQTLIDFETKPTGSAGNTIELLVNDITLDAPKGGNRENVETWDLTGQYRPTVAAGNTEISLTYK